MLPALDFTEAQQISTRLPEGQWVIAGEKNADPFPGCLSYDPLALSGANVQGRDVVYATSNGTVALRRAAYFSQIYAASLRNGRAVADHVIKHTESEDIVLICSGSLGRFSLEDFYGAGYLIRCLQEASNHSFICSDAALAAEMVWNDRPPSEVIRAARLGRLMLDRGMAASLDYVS
ncbi:2-phosphosulfolactate phosphatase [Pusillimonas sp. MFBS29]|nr:2-phosphosulfolactate phosphatase [Pusillimonas sp. MFBS29]